MHRADSASATDWVAKYGKQSTSAYTSPDTEIPTPSEAKAERLRAARERQPRISAGSMIEEPIVCEVCRGHGYRIEVSPGVSVNATAARSNGIKGRKMPCLSCAGNAGRRVA